MLCKNQSKFQFLHIADPTALFIAKYGFKTVGLLGTIFTMEADFYKKYLTEKYGLEILVPEKNDREVINDIIYDELCVGKIVPKSHEKCLSIINELTARGAECVILGCTEIMLLVNEKDCSVPMFDTTSLHADAAVELSLSEDIASVSA